MRAAVIVCAMTLGLVQTGVATAASPAEDARADIQKTLGFVPGFLAAAPDAALPGAWAVMKSIQMNPNTAISPKDKELIGLAVAAQIPCDYCVEAHRAFAKAAGATDEELKEAVGMSAIVRQWSTVMNGIMPAEQAWKDDVQKMAESARKAASQKDEPEAQAAERRTPEATSPGGATPEATTPVTTAEQAKEQIRSMLGTVPVMFERFPDEGLAGAWVEMRDLEMSAKTALSPKVKTLIGLAVSAQIPCTYCVQAHTEFAKAFGASERERDEAVAMASIVRHWSTIANGMQIERESFDKDVSKMVDALKKGTVVEQEKYDEE